MDTSMKACMREELTFPAGEGQGMMAGVPTEGADMMLLWIGSM